MKTINNIENLHNQLVTQQKENKDLKEKYQQIIDKHLKENPNLQGQIIRNFPSECLETCNNLSLASEKYYELEEEILKKLNGKIFRLSDNTFLVPIYNEKDDLHLEIFEELE